MKTVSGKLISWKPIYLSKAARTLSGFAEIEHGASDAVSIYVDRAVDAFNRLVRFHKELKNTHSHSKNRTHRVKIEENADLGKVESSGRSKKNSNFEVKVEGVRAGLDFNGNDEKDMINERKSEENLQKKKKVKSEQISDDVGEEMEEKDINEKHVDRATPPQVAEKRKNKHTMRDEEPIKIKQEGTGTEKFVADEAEQGTVKMRGRKKRKRRDNEEAGQSMECVERDSKGIDDGVAIDLAEQNVKKKKKRRKTERVD